MGSSTAPRLDAAAPLILLSAPGLLLPMHDAQPMIAVLAGHALAYWGLAQLPHQRSGSIYLSLGLGLAALAGGLDALLPLLPLILLPLFHKAWRNATVLLALLLSIAVAGAIITAAVLWLGVPCLLYTSPSPRDS